jgi:uncharacterized membrane protein YfcA
MRFALHLAGGTAMSLSVVAGAVLAVLVGIALGLLGGGGSILTLPILVYVVGVPAHEAIALSLLIVGTTSVAALVPHAWKGRVRWKTGALFGATSMVGAYGAGKLAPFIPGTALLVLFAVLMLVTAFAMMRRSSSASDPPDLPEGRLRDLPRTKIVLEGLAVGAVTGLVGAGGGFLVVPALVLLGRLPMRVAVGTSLLVIAMKSFAGFAGYVSSVSVDVELAALLTTAAVVGSVGGGALAGRVPARLLRRGFAWLVVVMGVFILLVEIPRALGAPIDLHELWPLALAAAAVPLVLAVLDLVRCARTAETP